MTTHYLLPAKRLTQSNPMTGRIILWRALCNCNVWAGSLHHSHAEALAEGGRHVRESGK